MRPAPALEEFSIWGASQPCIHRYVPQGIMGRPWDRGRLRSAGGSPQEGSFPWVRFPGAGTGRGGGSGVTSLEEVTLERSLERGAGVHQVERRGSEEASRRELCGQRPAGVRLCRGWSLLGRGTSKVRRAGAGARRLRDSGPHPEGTGEPSVDLGRKMESTV